MDNEEKYEYWLSLRKCRKLDGICEAAESYRINHVQAIILKVVGLDKLIKFAEESYD